MNKKEKFIQQTLVLSHQIPLFDYNVNFKGLKQLLQNFNVALNSQKQQIDQLKHKINFKAEKQKVQQQFALINGAMNLPKQILQKIKQKKNNDHSNQIKRPIDQICQKFKNITSAITKSLTQNNETSDKLKNLEIKTSDSLNNINNKLQQKIQDLDKTLNKNIQNYFRQAATNFVRLQTLIKQSQVKNATKISDAFTLLSKKVTEQYVNSKIAGVQAKIQGNVRTLLDNDSVKRLNFSNDLNKKLKQTQEEINQQQLQSQNKILELIQKISKSLPINIFEKQKSRIYEKFSQFKGKTDDMITKIQDYLQFKKQTIINGQKIRQQILTVEDQIELLKQKNQTKGGINDIASLLQKLDPHKICQLDAAVKLHTDQIGKLQKKLLSFQNDKSTKRDNYVNPNPQKNGISIQDMMKYIKQYINNMDIETRIKKNQKDIYQIQRKNDNVADLQKKFFLFTKQIDIGSINKELAKKSLQQNTRKQFKITQSKIDQLYQFLRNIRKDLDYVIDFVKKNEYKTKQPSQNALLTGKKLYPISCLSCYPSGGNRVRNGRTIKTPNLQSSFEINELNKTLNQDEQNRRVSLNINKYKMK